MASIKAGDVVALGGVVTLAPEQCECCGKAATEFEPLLSANPWDRRLVGRCGPCATAAQEESAWIASLPEAVANAEKEIEAIRQAYPRPAQQG